MRLKKVLYVDCLRGIASDMLVAALLGCFDDKTAILRELQDKICNNMQLIAESAKSYEREGLIFDAMPSGQTDWKPNSNGDGHCHSNLRDVHEFIDGTDFSEDVKRSAKSVYDIIAAAEAEAHGVSPKCVHFHEVGRKRAIACIVCACALINKLKPYEIIFSAVNTGYGKVRCAHGEIDIPAPATQAIIRNIPNFRASLSGELCTPTGAALVKFFATSFISETDENAFYAALPQHGNRVSTGLGRRDIGVANGVRITPIKA